MFSLWHWLHMSTLFSCALWQSPHSSARSWWLLCGLNFSSLPSKPQVLATTSSMSWQPLLAQNSSLAMSAPSASFVPSAVMG